MTLNRNADTLLLRDKNPRAYATGLSHNVAGGRFFRSAANELRSTSRANLVYGVQLSDILSR